MPHATFDFTTKPPTLWVVWRHNGTYGLGGSFGGCIRRFFVSGSGTSATLVPLDDALTIDGMDSEDSVSGQGGLKVAAGDGAVTVVYSKTDHVVACSDVQNASDSRRGVGWGWVASFNKGHDFLNHITIFHSDQFAWCVFPKQNPTIQNSIRAFDFVRTATGIEYVAINDTASTIRLFMSPAAGAGGWENATSEVNTWFEFCPGTRTARGDKKSPISTWRSVDEGPCPPGNVLVPHSSSNGVALFPTLAVDGRGRLGVSFTRSADGAQTALDAMFLSLASPQVAAKFTSGALQTLSPPLASSFSPPAGLAVDQKTVSQPLGAYMGMVGKTMPRAGCDGEGDFFPFWVQSDSSGLPQIATRDVSVSP